MSKDLIREKLLSKLQDFELGRPIAYRELRGCGSDSATYRAVKHFCQIGILERVMTGFYVRPKQLTSIPGITVSCNTEELAKAWAKERGYILTTTDIEEAYRLRFQTQAPMQKQYWTNGPNKIFKVGNARVFTIHVSNRLLLWHDLPIGRLYRALQFVPVDNAALNSLRKAMSIICPDDHEKEVVKSLLLKIQVIERWHPTIKES